MKCSIKIFCFILSFSFLIFLASCSVTKQIGKQADVILLNDTAIRTGHIGISIYEPATDKYWYNYNATKYFIPASNTKLFTLYAGMKYLGDSLVGAMVEERWDRVRILGTGDPTFLNSEFSFQPVWEYLQSKKQNKLNLVRKFTPFNNYSKPIPVYGNGWTWNDYDEAYMAERNFFPIYGNVVRFSIDDANQLQVFPRYFKRKLSHSKNDTIPLTVMRSRDENYFTAAGSLKSKTQEIIPFKTGSDFGDAGRYIVNTVDSVLSDTLGVVVHYSEAGLPEFVNFKKIHSQPSDSLFKPMMHRSDNFFCRANFINGKQRTFGLYE